MFEGEDNQREIWEGGRGVRGREGGRNQLAEEGGGVGDKCQSSRSSLSLLTFPFLPEALESRRASGAVNKARRVVQTHVGTV